MQYLLSESPDALWRISAGNANQVLFANSILGGENMDLMELQTCILSVVTIADTPTTSSLKSLAVNGRLTSICSKTI